MGMESLCWLWLRLANWLPDGVCLYLGILSARDATDCIYFSLSNTKSQKTTNSLHPLPPFQSSTPAAAGGREAAREVLYFSMREDPK